MTIRDIVSGTALLLGEEELFDSLYSELEQTKEQKEKTEIFTRLSNLVINQLSCSFIPMKTEEEQRAKLGKIYYNELSQRALKIIDVLDSKWQKTEYEQTPVYIKVKEKKVIVVYNYLPPNYAIDDKIGYLENEVPVVVLSYGVAGQYLVSKGRWEESVYWQKRYSEGIESVIMPHNRNIKRRGWIL